MAIQIEKSTIQKVLAFASQIKRYKTPDKIIVSDAGEFTSSFVTIDKSSAITFTDYELHEFAKKLTLKACSDQGDRKDVDFPGFDVLTENDKALKKAYGKFMAKLPSTAQVKNALEWLNLIKGLIPG